MSGHDPGPRESDRGLRVSVNEMPLRVYVRLYKMSETYEGEPVTLINIWLHVMVGLVEGQWLMLRMGLIMGHKLFFWR